MCYSFTFRAVRAPCLFHIINAYTVYNMILLLISTGGPVNSNILPRWSSNDMIGDNSALFKVWVSLRLRSKLRLNPSRSSSLENCCCPQKNTNYFLNMLGHDTVVLGHVSFQNFFQRPHDALQNKCKDRQKKRHEICAAWWLMCNLALLP